ncbi:SOS response-associated peptidase [Flavobacterium buctense]|uniref:Abasic site processing protein n=1 Tax=Flavobacterium buctense TaxID=1648146 RepID=A0ABU9DZV1_9FLAO|nr:SOS response-associated peptidase [Flavobacterium buctense]
MCFYFGLPENIGVIKKRFNREVKNSTTYQPNEKFNGFAHPENLLITNEAPELITTGSWGLLPQWSKDLAFRKNTLNARIETASQLPSFRDYNQNRCLVPASRFYEWRHEGKTKIPYIIVSSEHESDLFCFAGLYSDWNHPATGQLLRTFTILTTEGNDTMKYVHNTKERMPVILHQTDEDRWLQGANLTEFAYPYHCRLTAFTL